MDRLKPCIFFADPNFPHARGDGPFSTGQKKIIFAFSPRTWGWTADFRLLWNWRRIFPTHVGMDRWQMHPIWLADYFPHARGDGPFSTGQKKIIFAFSPRTWGWTEHQQYHQKNQEIFPTHVGMDRPVPFICYPPQNFPHARGDGPYSS